MTFAKAHKFIVTCYWERDSRPCVLSLRDVARKGEASAFVLQKLGWQATKQPFLEIIDKIRTNMLVSPVISETEMESRDFSHPAAMYSKCAHSVALERFLHVFANTSIQVHSSAALFLQKHFRTSESAEFWTSAATVSNEHRIKALKVEMFASTTLVSLKHRNTQLETVFIMPSCVGTVNNVGGKWKCIFIIADDSVRVEMRTFNSFSEYFSNPETNILCWLVVGGGIKGFVNV